MSPMLEQSARESPVRGSCACASRTKEMRREKRGRPSARSPRHPGHRPILHPLPGQAAEQPATPTPTHTHATPTFAPDSSAERGSLHARSSAVPPPASAACEATTGGGRPGVGVAAAALAPAAPPAAPAGMSSTRPSCPAPAYLAHMPWISQSELPRSASTARSRLSPRAEPKWPSSSRAPARARSVGSWV